MLLIVAGVLLGLRVAVWLLGIGAMEHHVDVGNRTTGPVDIDVWLGKQGAPVWRFRAVPSYQGDSVTVAVHAHTPYEVRATFADGEEVRTSCGYQHYRYHDITVTVLPKRVVVCTHTEYGSSVSW